MTSSLLRTRLLDASQPGWTAFPGRSTCCRSCQGAEGPHAKDCSTKNRPWSRVPLCARGCGRALGRLKIPSKVMKNLEKPMKISCFRLFPQLSEPEKSQDPHEIKRKQAVIVAILARSSCLRLLHHLLHSLSGCGRHRRALLPLNLESRAFCRDPIGS